MFTRDEASSRDCRMIGSPMHSWHKVMRARFSANPSAHVRLPRKNAAVRDSICADPDCASPRFYYGYTPIYTSCASGHYSALGNSIHVHRLLGIEQFLKEPLTEPDWIRLHSTKGELLNSFSFTLPEISEAAGRQQEGSQRVRVRGRLYT
jgi:hypothetical protein